MDYKLSEKFEINETFVRLAHRRFTFYKMMQHLDKSPSGYIVETGCSRSLDNWEGEGQSTQIWEWVMKESKHKFNVISIDITQGYVDQAKSLCPSINFYCGDSVKTLDKILKEDKIIKQTRLLYLDSFDWSKEAHLDSSFHHMAELASVWSNLPKGCLIVVDDRHSAEMGKHFMVSLFMEKLGIIPFFEEYQIGWIKP